MDMEKDKRIAKEIKKLKKIAKQVPADKTVIADNLVKELAFIAVTLEDLRENINENGAVDFFKQGAQEFYRESPALKSYNTTIQRYSLLYKQLIDLLPKADPRATGSDLLDFINE